MRKIVLIIITLFIFQGSSSAQVYDNAIGLRVSGVRGHSGFGSGALGAELTYQYGLSESTRIDVGIGISSSGSYDRFGVLGAAHKVFEIESGFSWFVGPAVQIWGYAYDGDRDERGVFGVALGAQGGVGYDFDELDLPFIVSVDARPMINFAQRNSGFELSVGLSARYVF